MMAAEALDMDFEVGLRPPRFGLSLHCSTILITITEVFFCVLMRRRFKCSLSTPRYDAVGLAAISQLGARETELESCKIN